MAEAIQTIKAADAGISAITDLLQQAKALITAARSASASEITSLQNQYDELLDQIADLADDSGYKGTNLLDAATLTVDFDEAGESSLDIVGFSATTSGAIGDVNISAANFSTSADMDNAVGEIDDALTELRTQSKTLSSNLSVVTSREEFTTNMINTLQEGADKLTLADMNEEGANMLMLQTRQALGTTALSLSSQAAQAVLRLF